VSVELLEGMLVASATRTVFNIETVRLVLVLQS